MINSKQIGNIFLASCLFLLLLGLTMIFFISRPVFASANIAYSFAYPLQNYTKLSLENFGENRGGEVWHLGNDVVAPAGTAVTSIADGYVKNVGVYSRFGAVVLIEHTLPDASQVVSLYGHLRESDISVKAGQFVKIGQVIGYLGNREENGGWGEHLHLGIRKGGFVEISQGWVYYGLGTKSLLDKWHNPTAFIDSHARLADTGARILAGAGPIGSTHLRSFYVSGEKAEIDSWALDRHILGGADVAAADITGDGRDEIIFGAGPGSKPLVSIRDRNNKEISTFLAYNENFRGGIRVAAGDVDGDGKDEIITAPRAGGGGQVLIYEADGTRRSLEFWPYGPYFRGGIDVAVGNIDLSEPKQEIIVAPESGYKPLVKIYKPKWGNEIYSEFLAFAENFTGGVRLAVADVDLDGVDEVIVGAASRGGHVRVLEPKDGSPRGIDYFPFGPTYRSGVDVSAADFDGDGKPEIIIGSSGNSTAHIKVYRFNFQREILAEFWPYGKNFFGGCNVTGYNLNVK
jgi:hypothetical protein